MSAPKSLFAAAPSRFLSREECEAIAKKVLSFATAEATSVSVGGGVQSNTRFAVNQVSTSGDSYDAQIAVRSSFGRRSASAVTNSFDDASLKSVVERAEALAKLAPEDPEHMPLLGPQQYREASPAIW